MKCHYEVLDVSKDATLSEIKLNYRKFALKWHPDKNLENTDYAKEKFHLVQQAYDVLSDPQERTWYDIHREQILLGYDTLFDDKSLDVFPYFSTTCFRGYGDEENGFYAVFRGVFDRIIAEDLDFIEDKAKFSEIPRFGYATSDYDEIVRPFYSYWSSYSTRKSYVWLDPYNINQKRDRRVLKLFEKENKKVRQKAKKERNEEIRNLVAFVRKRDKRVQEYSKLMEVRMKENKQKQMEFSKMKRLERKIEESLKVGEWAKFDNVKLELEEIEEKLANEFSEKAEITYDFYCAACYKLFKTIKAMENHESSKKHKENEKILRKFFYEERELDVEANLIEELSEKTENLKEDNNIELISEKCQKEIETLKEEEKVGKFSNDKISQNSDSAKEKWESLVYLKENFDKKDYSDLSKKQRKNSKKTKSKKEAEKNLPNKQNRQIIIDVLLDLDLDLIHCYVNCINCFNCKAKFKFKFQLFNHFKKTGHGVYIMKVTERGIQRKNNVVKLLSYLYYNNNKIAKN